MEECALTLTEATEKYIIRRQMDKKKYFVSYLTIAADVWKEMFVNTLWAVKTEWMPLKKGMPYNYIDMPRNCARLLSVSTLNHSQNIIPLFYNNQMNVVPRPVVKKCGCDKCDCSGLCESVNSMNYTTKLLFTINGVEYYEKIWTKYCPNGDILEYREVPTKKYNDYIGSAGDFNDDFNNAFSIGAQGFENYTIVTEKFQRILCSLKTKECGCPENTEENKCLLQEFCGCFLNWGWWNKQPQEYMPPINSNHKGEVKISECGTKIYYRPQRHHGKDSRLPDYLLVSFQTTGASIEQASLVPQYALSCLWAGVDWESKRFNNRYSATEKEMARIAYEKEQNDVVLYLNPLSLEMINQTQDIRMLW